MQEWVAMLKAKWEQRRSRWWSYLSTECSDINAQCSLNEVCPPSTVSRTGRFPRGDGSGVRPWLPAASPKLSQLLLRTALRWGAPWWVFQERGFLTGWGKAGQRHNSWSCLGNRWEQWKIHLVKSGLKSTQKLSQLLGLGRQSTQCLKAFLPFFLPNCLPPFFSFLFCSLPFFLLFLFFPFFFFSSFFPLPAFFPLFLCLSPFLLSCSLFFLNLHVRLGQNLKETRKVTELSEEITKWKLITS